MEKVDWEDIQGLVTSGYGRLPFAAYVLWQFQGGKHLQAKAWLGQLAGRLMRVGTDANGMPQEVTTAAPPTTLAALERAGGRRKRAINLALTATGLKKLGVEGTELATFSPEFLDGMAPRPSPQRGIARRSNLLGDVGASSPEHWDWGGWNKNGDIDGMLLLYADTDTSLQVLLQEERDAMASVAQLVGPPSAKFGGQPVLEGRFLGNKENNPEHFGYRDGLSQPVIEGSRAAKELHPRRHRKQRSISVVQPGEFVLGYPNERGISVSPPPGVRPKRNLWRNGSYLVFRQLEQDVDGFEDFVEIVAKRIFDSTNPEAKERVRGKLLGRGSAGQPLVQAAAHAPAEPPRNDFLYHFEDPIGIDCPVGAHVRRSNPRDTIGGCDPDTALRLSRMHRIIRRGRPYGEPRNGAAPQQGSASRGMNFICLNADIAGQFELIQHSWLNNTHFGEHYVGTDPFSHFPDTGGIVTIPMRPINIQVARPKAFVRVRGGAYFFMPGIKALRELASGPVKAQDASPSVRPGEASPVLRGTA